MTPSQLRNRLHLRTRQYQEYETAYKHVIHLHRTSVTFETGKAAKERLVNAKKIFVEEADYTHPDIEQFKSRWPK